MAKRYDCIVAGSCVVDMLCRPVDLSAPIGAGVLHAVDPLLLTGGGIVSNSGVAMARLGMRVGAFSYIGDDAWAPVLRDLYRKEGVDAEPLLPHPNGATSTTVVMIDPSGERSFYHCVGAPLLLDAQTFMDHMALFENARMLLLGYYSLMPKLEADLPQVFEALRKAGCQTAMDPAGSGGSLQPLDKILPHLDYYVPSLLEAKHQTGLDDPERIIETYRSCDAPGVLGVKLGTDGVLLSPKADQFTHIKLVDAPGDVLDTTGAGDSFLAGLLSGVLKGMSLEDAGKLGAAAAACCVTALGGSAGVRDYAATATLAGLK
jgi:sugar/nucleoside kinase (ribokinase family)